jgi:hypothetical protein
MIEEVSAPREESDWTATKPAAVTIISRRIQQSLM